MRVCLRAHVCLRSFIILAAYLAYLCVRRVGEIFGKEKEKEKEKKSLSYTLSGTSIVAFWVVKLSDHACEPPRKCKQQESKRST